VVDLDGLERLPRGYDVVLVADTLEHLADPDAMLRRVHAALGSGGRLLLSVPNVANLYLRLNLLWGRWEYADRGILDRTHRYFFTRRSLRAMLEDAGFAVDREVVSTVPLPLAMPWLRGPWLRLASGALAAATRLRPSLFGYQLIVDARRV
jgi:2-polyprenyl-3-methyl-5-hydroxy-6-metoxy-1,4-benzoquinol methylase